MKPTRKGMIVLALLACLSTAVLAAGSFSDLPQIGGPSYCASYNANSPSVTGQTGQTGVGTCVQTVPAGPTVFAGTEYAPFDIGPLGGSVATSPTTGVVGIVQLGQGPYLDVTSPATATIPNNTPFYFLDGTQGSAFTITMPSAPLEGQIQHVVCESATTGALTVAANTNQTLKNNPDAACAVGVDYTWRYVAANSTWYRF